MFLGATGMAQKEADLPGAKSTSSTSPASTAPASWWSRTSPTAARPACPHKLGEDEDRLHQVLDVLDYLSAPYGSEENLFVQNGIEGRHYDFDEHGVPVPITKNATELGVQYVGVDSGATPGAVHPRHPVGRVVRHGHGECLAQHSIARPLEGLEVASQTFVTKGAQLRSSCGTTSSAA